MNIRNSLLASVFAQVAEQSGAGDGTEPAVNVSAGNGDAAVEHDAAEIPQAIDDMLRTLVIKGEDVKAGPVTLYHAFASTPSPSDPDLMLIDEFPRVGSKHNDDPRPNRAELYRGKDEAGKDQDKNWFTEWFKDTPTGKRWAGRINALNAASALMGSPETVDEFKKAHKDVATEAELAEMIANRNNKRWIEDEKSLYTTRLGSGRQMVRKAVMIRDTFDKLETYCGSDTDPGVIRLRWNTTQNAEGKAVMKRTKYPVWIINAADPSEINPVSIGDFLKFNNEDTIKKAEKLGGTYQAFCDAIKRDAKPKAGEGKGKVKLETIEQVQDVAAALASWMDAKASDGNKHKAVLLTELMKPANDELVLAIGSVVMELDGIWPKIEGRYNRLVAENEKRSGSNERKVA